MTPLEKAIKENKERKEKQRKDRAITNERVKREYNL